MASKSRATERSEGGSSAPEQTIPSTTWAWKRVKISRPPEGNRERGPKGLHTWVGRSRWDPRKDRVTIRIRYRGGAECWYEVEARGATARLTGTVALHDLMVAICHHH